MSDNIWQDLAAPLEPSAIKTKSYSTKRGDNVSIRYIDMQTALDRLDAVCPGEWQFTLDIISAPPEGSDGQWVVRGTMIIAGVSRTDLGINDNQTDYDPPKAAVSDAFKRCARQFGIGSELYRKETPAAIPAKSKSPVNVEPHWARGNLKSFWAWTKGELGLTDAEVHEALEVESVKAFLGSKDQAVKMLEVYAEAKRESV